MNLENYELLKESVYKVNTALGSGSCFKIMPANIFVSNYHVIEGSKKVALEDHERNRYLAEVRYINPEADIAFLSCEALKNKPGINFSNPTMVSTRDQVSVLGFPFGMPFTITEGIVSNQRQLLEGSHYIQTDAAVNPGNSGGPVVNTKGNLVGIATSKFAHADNVGFAIPAPILIDEINTFNNAKEQGFVVKCNACKNAIVKATEYCPVCGAEINEHLFEDVLVNPLAQFIEESISSLKSDPILARAGKEYWEFHFGSSLIRIYVHNKNYLYATSPLNSLPSENLEELYTFLLSNPIAPYQLGINNHQIYISYRTHLSDIFDNNNKDIQNLLSQMLVKADEMDDFFVQNFNCKKTNFSKEV